MKLVDLSPQWIIPGQLFVMRCPHCPDNHSVLLSCKNIPMKASEQYDHFEKVFGENWNAIVVPCKDEMAWNFSTLDFATMTVTPSLDASNSGHAHFNIQNGEIV